MSRIHTSLSKALLAVASLAATALAECTREGLFETAFAYVEAQAAGSIENLNLSPDNFTYQLNNEIEDISKGIISSPLKIDLNRSTADTVACASYTLIISAAGSQPYVIATQIRHTDNDTSSIAMIDTIAATTGDLFFNAQRTLDYIKKEDWTELAPERRPSRELLKSVGDGYLDMWTDAGAADRIPWGTECERVEGSQYTNPCGKTLPRGGSKTPNGMRRYVIDEVMGSVDVLCAFDSLGDLPDSHEVRVEDELVKYVHTVTVVNSLSLGR